MSHCSIHYFWEFSAITKAPCLNLQKQQQQQQNASSWFQFRPWHPKNPPTFLPLIIYNITTMQTTDKLGFWGCSIAGVNRVRRPQNNCCFSKGILLMHQSLFPPPHIKEGHLTFLNQGIANVPQWTTEQVHFLVNFLAHPGNCQVAASRGREG